MVGSPATDEGGRLLRLARIPIAETWDLPAAPIDQRLAIDQHVRQARHVAMRDRLAERAAARSLDRRRDQEIGRRADAQQADIEPVRARIHPNTSAGKNTARRCGFGTTRMWPTANSALDTRRARPTGAPRKVRVGFHRRSRRVMR